MVQDNLIERRISSQKLFQGNFLHAYRDQVQLPDGKSVSREYVVHPGAVMIVPLLTGSGGAIELVLERQYRYPVQRVVTEFPAGKLDAGEASLACARRELWEETGYCAAQWAYAGLLHPVVSYSTEFIDVWFARDLQLGRRQLDEGEFLEVFTASSDQFFQWCRDGQITDAKTLVAGLWLQNVLTGTWPLQWQACKGTRP